MTSQNEPSIEYVRMIAEQSGLALSEEEVNKLVKGIARGRDMAETVRRVAYQESEPAPVFEAAPPANGREVKS